MQQVNILKPGRCIATTSATPILCQCDDGNNYFTKFYEGVEGPRELVNEYIAYRIAKLIKLPIPEAALLRPNPSTDFYIAGLEKCINSTHLAFGSKELTKVISAVDEEVFESCNNKADFLPIIVFDHIIGNQDRERNVGNLLMRVNDRIIFIIDHGRIFEQGTLWDKRSCIDRMKDIKLKDLSDDSIYGMMLNTIDINQYRADCISKFSQITREKLQEIFDSIPEEWECSDDDKYGAMEFILYRLEKVEEIINQIEER